MTLDWRPNEAGFTLNETLVAVNVGFLLVSFCLMTVLLFSKQMKHWQERTGLKESVNGLVQQMAIDAQASNFINLLSDTLLVFDKPGKEIVAYRLTELGIYRNDQRYGSADVNLKTHPRIQTHGNEQILHVEVYGKARQYEYSSEITVGTLSSSRTRFVTQFVR